MSNDKPKGSRKKKPARDLLDAATVGLQQFRRFAKRVNKLSTTEKIVGGLVVLAAGYAFVTSASPAKTPAQTAALEVSPPPVTPSTPNPKSPARAPKPRRNKLGTRSKHVPFSVEHA